MSERLPHIAVIGSGLVANFFSRVFYENKIQISQIISRNKVSGMELANAVHSEYEQDLSKLKPCDLVFLAVNDDSINEVINGIPIDGFDVVHTAGAVSMDVLNKFRNFGVVYPLQSMRRKVDVEHVPVLIETSSEAIKNKIKKVLNACNFKIYEANSSRRLNYHLTAVFANNFTNAMLAASEKLAHQKDLDFSLLKPLIENTFNNATSQGASNSQTGPAHRDDKATMLRHLRLLENDTQLQNLYQQMSDFIASQIKK
jgi:predicted short-subunit dehydrogenase-like oxidoreductase (DUF2520 family)